MKAPICAFDARTGVLCPKCESKLRGGHLTESDVSISIELAKLAERIREVDKITLIRASQVEEDYVLVVTSGDLGHLRKDPTILQRLEEGLGRKVWVIEAEASNRKVFEDLFYPMRILTVSIVWLPDGSKLTKAIIPEKRNEGPGPNIEMIKKVVKEVRGIDLMVEFEESPYQVRRG